MIHKTLVAFAALLAAFAAYAQKPVCAAVSDIEDDPGNGLEMCRSLFNEYFLSELTTHAKVNMIDTASVQREVANMKLVRGEKLSGKQVRELCSKLKIDAVCLVKMSKKSKDKITVSVELIDKDGKEAGKAEADMKGIGDTDSVSYSLAGKCAVILRKIRGIDEAESQKAEKQSEAKPLPSTVTAI